MTWLRRTHDQRNGKSRQTWNKAWQIIHLPLGRARRKKINGVYIPSVVAHRDVWKGLGAAERRHSLRPGLDCVAVFTHHHVRIQYDFEFDNLIPATSGNSPMTASDFDFTPFATESFVLFQCSVTSVLSFAVPRSSSLAESSPKVISAGLSPFGWTTRVIHRVRNPLRIVLGSTSEADWGNRVS